MRQMNYEPSLSASDRYLPGLDPVQEVMLKKAQDRGCSFLASAIRHPNGRVGVHLDFIQPNGHIYRRLVLMRGCGQPKTFSTRQQADVWLWNKLGTRLMS